MTPATARPVSCRGGICNGCGKIPEKCRCPDEMCKH